ncbi:hypothetical protein BD769DRAFT_1396845 [Suillus cothurnatus]|nr:hypothetical protein BD769DRAFT_1396845 [Suillus cothurnatus]
MIQVTLQATYTIQSTLGNWLYSIKETGKQRALLLRHSLVQRLQRPFVRILEVLCTAAHGIKYMFGMEFEASNLMILELAVQKRPTHLQPLTLGADSCADTETGPGLLETALAYSSAMRIVNNTILSRGEARAADQLAERLPRRKNPVYSWRAIIQYIVNANRTARENPQQTSWRWPPMFDIANKPADETNCIPDESIGK